MPDSSAPSVRARVRRRLVRVARGPVRSRLRSVQSRSPLLAGGRVPGPPDFVGIGVQRAGTSWWHGVLQTHPLIDDLGWTAKELHFFDDFWGRDPDAEDLRRYRSHFLRRPGHLTGEWTPRYLSDPWAVRQLHAAAPDARLLVMLRDPIDRLQSGLNHAAERLGGVTPDLVADAVARGRYAAQLARVFDVVPREQVLVLQFERCRREQQAMADETFGFLGLDPVPVPTVAATNASSSRIPLSPALLASATEAYAADVRDLLSLVPGVIDADLWARVPASPESPHRPSPYDPRAGPSSG